MKTLTPANESLTPEQSLETMRALLAGVSGVKASEIFIRRVRTLEIRSKNQEISACRESTLTSMGLRLAKEGSCIVSSTTNLSAVGLKELLSRARTLLRASQSGPHKRIATVDDVPTGVSYDGSFNDVPLEEKVSRVLNMGSLTIKAAKKYPQDVKTSYFEREHEEWLWAPGAKRGMTHRSVWAQIAARALHEKTEGTKGFETTSLKTQFFDLDWSGMARSAAEGALFWDDARIPESGSYRALVDATVMLHFVRLLGEALRGDRVLTGRSFLDVSQIGKAIFSPDLNLHDDPERISRAGYRLWDAEGKAVQKKSFIQEGILQGFAFDSSAGWREGYESNGQAIRPEIGAQPYPGFHSLAIPANSRDVIDLKRDLGTGLWLQGIESLSMLQPGSGEFVACFSGRWIEGGETSHGLTRILVRGDLKTLFSKIVSTARDVTWNEHYGSPSVLISDLEVIGA